MTFVPSIQSYVGAHSGGSKAAVDWSRNVMYQVNGSWLTVYGILTGLENNFVATANFGGTGQTLFASMPGIATGDGHLGLSISENINASALATADRTTFAMTNYLPYPSSLGTGGITGVTKNNAQFFVDKGIGNTVVSTLNRVNYVDDGTAYFGTQDFAGAGGRCCAGPLGDGTAYILSPQVGGIDQINLSKAVFNGITWTGTTSVRNYVPTDVDAGWSNAFFCGGVCLDQTDGKLLAVFQGGGNANKAYITKVKPSTGAIEWKTVIPATNGGGPLVPDDVFQYSRIRYQQIAFYTGSPATVTRYSTVDGSVLETYTNGIAGLHPTSGGQCYDDSSGAIILNTDFTQGGDSPTLLNSTPTSWSAGWAALYVAPPITPVLATNTHATYLRIWGNYH